MSDLNSGLVLDTSEVKIKANTRHRITTWSHSKESLLDFEDSTDCKKSSWAGSRSQSNMFILCISNLPHSEKGRTLSEDSLLRGLWRWHVLLSGVFMFIKTSTEGTFSSSLSVITGRYLHMDEAIKCCSYKKVVTSSVSKHRMSENGLFVLELLFKSMFQELAELSLFSWTRAAALCIVPGWRWLSALSSALWGTGEGQSQSLPTWTWHRRRLLFPVWSALKTNRMKSQNVGVLVPQCFLRDCFLTSVLGDNLRQGELLPVHVLKVMLLQGPLDHLSCFVLGG